MKLLFCIKTIDGARGGAERVLTVIASALADANHEVSLLSFDGGDDAPFYPLKPSIQRVRLPIGNPRGTTTARDMWQRVPALRRAITQAAPDVVVAFMHSMYVPCAIALAGTGIPIVASEHTVPAHYTHRRLEYSLLLATSPLVSRYTAVSDTVRMRYPAVVRHKMTAVPNPVESPKGAANTHVLDGQRGTVLSVGRLDPEKDHATLITAFARLAQRYTDWDLRIIGEGHLRLNLERLVASLGLADRVSLPGATPDVAREYRGAQIFALPSRYESFGLATAEAMSYGLPAVGFADCPGTNELIVHQRTGLLAQGADRVKAMQSCLEHLMSSPETRSAFGDAARLAVAGFGVNKIRDAWELLLENARDAGAGSQRRSHS